MTGGYQGGGLPDWRSGVAAVICALLALVVISLTILAIDALGFLDWLLR